MDISEKTEKYAVKSMYYLNNASKSIDAGDSEKSSEFLWGSIAQALKAVAASRGIALRNHRRIWDFADSLAKELEDKDIFDTFLHANYLHTNFYEAELEMKDVRRIAEDIKLTVGKLLPYIAGADEK